MNVIMTLTDTAMRLAADILRGDYQGMAEERAALQGAGEARYEMVCAALREVLLERLWAILDEWRRAVEARLPEEALRSMVAMQALEVAIEGVRRAANQVVARGRTH